MLRLLLFLHPCLFLHLMHCTMSISQLMFMHMLDHVQAEPGVISKRSESEGLGGP
jgi:hypothetical protein